MELEDRVFHGYILEDDPNPPSNPKKTYPCCKCELDSLCDRIADDLNHMEYCICLNGIKDKNYKKNHPNSYFKKIK